MREYSLQIWRRRDALIAATALAAILSHLVLRYVFAVRRDVADLPLVVTLVCGGVPLLAALLRQLLIRQFGSDLLAGVAIVTSVPLGEYLIAAVVVLMLSGGQALEDYATRRASSVLDALARRNPTVAHRRAGEDLVDIQLDDIRVGDMLVVLPHEICPADGVVRLGSSTMDESYLTGEPFLIRKTTGSAVISGAINGDAALTIAVERRTVDSRYARIMEIVRAAEENRPSMRRLADRLGAWYTPLALLVAAAGWLISGQPARFLAVMVIATPCPLLLAIPVAISLAAKRGIIITTSRGGKASRLSGTIYFGQSPEQKLAIVNEETRRQHTLFVGDGLNDAPAMMAATVGVAIGQNSDVTAEAAGAVILEGSLAKVDELIHIGNRMKRVARQSAVGGILLSVIGMAAAAFGLLPALAGVIAQEVIDVVAVLNALRAAIPPKDLTDF